MASQASVRRRPAGAPLHPRRISGPSRPRVVPGGAAAVALPQRRGVFAALRALPEHRLIDRLLRGRLCIWVIGAMLGGIVAMQVSLLNMNAGISRAVMTASTLERQNSDLQSAISRATAGDTIASAAAADGMVDPPAGEASYLRTRPGIDATLAAKRMQPPSAKARAVMANKGQLPAAFGGVAASTLAGAAATDGTVAAGTTPTTTTAGATAGATATGATGADTTTGTTAAGTTTDGTTAGTTTAGTTTAGSTTAGATSATTSTGAATAGTTTTAGATSVATPVPTVDAAPASGAATAPQG